MSHFSCGSLHLLSLLLIATTKGLLFQYFHIRKLSSAFMFFKKKFLDGEIIILGSFKCDLFKFLDKAENILQSSIFWVHLATNY